MTDQPTHPAPSGRPASTHGPAPGGPPPGVRPQAALPEPSLIPEQGWHVGHFFYRFRRDQLDAPLSPEVCQQFCDALAPSDDCLPERLASYWTSGHEADFGVIVMDPHPGKVDAIHQALLAPGIGRWIEPAWSFTSVSEVSEYVPSVEAYRERLIRQGGEPDSPELAAKVSAYERRLPMMNRNRLQPDIPDWPAACFYPMNKSRVPGANWFTEPFSLRNQMMAEHAQSGMAFAGKVSQLISVGVGLDNWEWMVTLWGRNPEYLKEIVYKMRFDEASAKYGEFGPFFVGYRADGREILDHCRMTG
ncbi:putative heme peroxidase [Allorhodopirellula heiligendammensis]|uniref:Heme peroxidase n=1 Tax=Allorhodopirellula heiligendammensis TaxID=2714739 RepID=A0A5C6BU76_9BACT|nr:putative heme peroxidase [Allorhodopirellula heiligendammensis]